MLIKEKAGKYDGSTTSVSLDHDCMSYCSSSVENQTKQESEFSITVQTTAHSFSLLLQNREQQCEKQCKKQKTINDNVKKIVIYILKCKSAV